MTSQRDPNAAAVCLGLGPSLAMAVLPWPLFRVNLWEFISSSVRRWGSGAGKALWPWDLTCPPDAAPREARKYCRGTDCGSASAAEGRSGVIQV